MTEELQPAPLGGETDLPDAIRLVAKGLVLDLRAFGFRDQPENHADLLKAETRAVQSLLDSNDPRLAMDGLRVVREIESERRKLAALELQHAKAGMEALVYYELSRLRMQGESGAQGPSPENMSAVMSRMMADLMAQDQGNDLPPSPEAETTPNPTDELTS